MGFHLSERSGLIKPSETIRLSSLVKELKNSGVDVVNLTAGEPDFDTPEHIRKAAEEAVEKGYTRYLPSAGIKDLREIIAEKTNNFISTSYTFENVVVCAGCKNAIFNSLMALCDPGDEVIIPSPYWVSYPYLVELTGAKPVYIDTKKTGFLLDPADLSDKITDKTKAVFINTPSNPVGNVYSLDLLEAIWKVLEKHPKIIVISDEIYDHIVFEGRRHHSFANVSESAAERTVIVNGVSKTFAMTGWRLGWLIAGTEIASAASKISSHTISCACSVSQMAALAALKEGFDCVNKMKEAYEKRKNIVRDMLSEIPSIITAPLQGAFFAWIDISAYIGKAFKGKVITSSDDMTTYLLKEKHVALVPGQAFGDDKAVRISYAASEGDIRKGIERFKEGLLALN
ncbi:pyridoxal phosphate-dependent aminotransferase [candidate division WOR-3 bacterium]|nr:pyridoxal phosphate-dependent aminotransferase [candidate division WOR-3 bacterium]